MDRSRTPTPPSNAPLFEQSLKRKISELEQGQGSILKDGSSPMQMSKLLDLSTRMRKRFRRLISLFMFYFVITVCFWGTAEFLLSYLATRGVALETGDTLAFISVGNFLGTCIAHVILWYWKKTSWASFIAPPPPSTRSFSPTTLVQVAPATLDEDDGRLSISDPSSAPTSPPTSQSSLESAKDPQKNRFNRVRSLMKKPVFLKDAFKLSFLSGFIGSVAPLGYYKLSMAGGQASTVAPLISLYVIVPTILGLVVLKERKSILKFLGIGLAIAAVVLFALGGGGSHWSLLSAQNFGFFSLGFFGWGISYFIRGIAASKVVDFGHLLLMATAGLMFGNYILIVFVFGLKTFSFSIGHILTTCSGLFQVLGDLGFFLLSKEGQEASKVVPLTGTYILLPCILGFVFLKDTVTVMKIIAIFLSLLAQGFLGAS